MLDHNKIPSIYVVDDDDAVRDSLAALLEPEGFIIRPFESADAFLAHLEENFSGNTGPCCLLLDLNMPGKSGMELLAALAERKSGLPVIVMTGNIDERTKTKALMGGAIAFLQKPVDADQLIDTLRAAY